ncbi:hypothetical protein Tco_0512274 [Tanacetum coccineum]
MVLEDHAGWKLRRRQWTGTTDQLIEDLEAAYDNASNMFSIRIHHGGKFQRYPGRMYVSGRVDIFDMVDIDLFIVVALNMMVLKLDEGLYALACEEDVRFLGTLVRSFKLIEVYTEHGVTALDSYHRAPRFRARLEEITDEPGSIAANRTEKIFDINLSFVSQQATASQVIDGVMRQLSFDETEFDGEAGFVDVTGSGVDSSGLSHDESFGVDDLDLNLNEPVNLNVSQVKTQSKLHVFEEPDVGRTQEPILLEVSTQELIVAEVSTQEPIVAEVSTEVPIVEEVGTQKFSVKDVVLEDYVSSGKEGEDVEQDNGIDTTYETEYDVQSSEDAGTDDDDDDDDVDEDFLVDEENEIVKPDVDVHLFGISMDLLFDNIGVTNLVSDDVLEGEDVDVINADGFDSDPGNDVEKKLQEEKKCTTPKEAKDRVYLHSIENRRNLKLYKNDGVRIRARCDGKVHVFTISQGTGPTSPNHGMEAGPSGSSGPTTRSKKRKNTGTNDDSQASPSFLDAHDKGDLCPWVLYVGKEKFTQNWVVRTHNGTHTCLQSREIKHSIYKFLSKKIFEQVKVNPNIPVKAVQDQLQRGLEVQISMSKAFRAKAKVEREIRGDHVLQYSMFRDYVVELQSTNPNTTVKIAVERNIDPSLPTRVFQRIYICLGALKLGFRACRRDLLGLDRVFMKGSFPGQVLVAVGLDSNNGIYQLDYALVEAETIKTVYLSAEHRYCLRNIHENMKQGWCGQAYKDLLWRVAFATNVRDFEKCRAKSDLLLNNICVVFNGKIVGGRDKPVITLLEYIREYCMKRIVNVQGGVIDKCIGPLTPTATRIMESIKKEAHLMKVKWELTRIPCNHVVAACWNMALNDRAAPPPETWVNPCYWLSTWKETYSHKIQPICGTKYWEKSTCPTTLLPPKHHVQVDGSFHSPEWHAARLASLKTSHTVTWEEYKKKQKEDELKKGELEADKDRMMREYRAQLDAERATKLAHGRNHSKSTPKSSSSRKDKDLKKHRSNKKRKYSRKSSESSSSSSSSESSSSSDDDSRESKRSKSRSRKRKDKRHRSKSKHLSGDEEADGPLPLSRFFGSTKS